MHITASMQARAEWCTTVVCHGAGGLDRWRRSLAEFSRGRRIRVRSHDGGYSIETVVARARSRLGEDGYRLLSNNCEHFCEWCVHGRNRSLQIEQWLARPRRMLLATLRFLAPGGRPAAGICEVTSLA